MAAPSLAWRVEETCLNAFPSLRQIIYRDWLLRLSDDFTRRANSINPRAERIEGIEADIDACAGMFAAAGQQPVFRVPDICDPRLDGLLEARGYSVEGRTVTLFAELSEAECLADAHVEISPRPTAEWLAAMGELQNRTRQQNASFAGIMATLAVPAGFAALREDGELTALTVGSIHDRILCFESVVTAERHRGRGHARRLLASLNAWARAGGAKGVCLQVEAMNVAGRALYSRLGLKRELYGYHYRRAPRPAD